MNTKDAVRFNEDLVNLANFTQAMAKAGADFTKPLNNPKQLENLATYLKLGCPQLKTTGRFNMSTCKSGEALARLALGNNFISLEEVSRYFRLTYSREQSQNMVAKLPSIEDIGAAFSEGTIILPGPPQELSLIDVVNLDRDTFKPNELPERYDDRYAMCTKDKICGNTWFAIQARHLLDVTGEVEVSSWEVLESHIPEGYRLLNLTEAAYILLVCRKIRELKLGRDLRVFTSSMVYSEMQRGTLNNDPSISPCIYIDSTWKDWIASGPRGYYMILVQKRLAG
jgi:hypothetical protein